jgi:hypothetical protein
MSDLRQLAASARQRLADGQQQLAAAWREKRDSAALLGGAPRWSTQVLRISGRPWRCRTGAPWQPSAATAGASSIPAPTSIC